MRHSFAANPLPDEINSKVFDQSPNYKDYLQILIKKYALEGRGKPLGDGEANRVP
jgi:hypothetical protein